MSQRMVLDSVYFRLGALLVMLPILIRPVMAGDKNDVIIFKNGDRLTGEIKKMEQGQLYFKNSSLYDTVQLDWEKIERILSSRHFILSLTSGERFTGLIEKVSGAADAKNVAIRGEQGVIRAAPREIVGIRPMEESFWKQLNGEIDFGLSYARGNQQTSLTLSGNVSRVTQRYRAMLTLDSQFSSQNEGATTNRHNLGGESFFFVRDKWFVPVLVNFLKSDQQQLELRTIAGGGFGRMLILTNRSYLAAYSGIVVNREKYLPETGRAPSDTGVEALAGFQYSTYRFDKTRFDTQLLALPSLSQSGRVRLDWKSNFRINLIGDLYWKMGFYANYDSAPPFNTRKSDYGTTATIGWSF